jgi:ribosomal-protein-alanine N-acetyltransferase
MPDRHLLCTRRLKLVPAAQSDADDMWPHLSDPEISLHMAWEPHSCKDETFAFLKRVEQDWGAARSLTWAIRCADTAEFVGLFSIINIHRIHRALVYDRGELAYWCVRHWRGTGVMAEAGHAVIDYAFDTVRLNRLVVGHHLDNLASESLIRKLGFEEIGVEHEAFQKHGKWIDIRIYELLQSRRKKANSKD